MKKARRDAVNRTLLLLLAFTTSVGAAGAAPLGEAAPATIKITSGALSPGKIDFRLPASEGLILDRRTSVQSDLTFNLPETDRSTRDSLLLRPSGRTSDEATPGTRHEVSPAGIAANSRAAGFVPWLETLYLASGGASGFAGSRGHHSKWSNEIDQWIAELDGFGAPLSRPPVRRR